MKKLLTLAALLLCSLLTFAQTASEAYLDIAKYKTIDIAGWNTSYVTNLYKYTEYPENNGAWLNLQAYGAFVGARYSTSDNRIGRGHPQAWIECTLGNNYSIPCTHSIWTNDTLTYTNPGIGSRYYFESDLIEDSWVLGTTYEQNWTPQIISFYVSNTSLVKLYGEGHRLTADSSFPARLRIYECTNNADGIITVNDLVDESENSLKSSFIMTSTTLDPTKIYKVEATIYRGWFHEICFQTPLKSPELVVTPTNLEFDTFVGTPIEKTFNVKCNNIEDNITATLTTNEDNVFSLETNNINIVDAESANGKDITITFNPTKAGTFTGIVTLNSPMVESKTITLNGVAKNTTLDYYDAMISNLGLSTMYLDFPVEIPYETYDPDLLGVYYIYDISDKSELKLARLNNYIPAHTGVIIQGNSGIYRFPKTNVVVDPLKRDNYLQGCVEQTTVDKVLGDTQNTCYMYTLGKGRDSYVGFYKYIGTIVPANKAFLVIEKTANAKALNLGFEELVTGITDIGSSYEDSSNWYSIQGIKLNGKPVRSGIYIQNGKIVSIKL